jgi:hypothetical protein
MSDELKIKKERNTPRADGIGEKINQVHAIFQDENSADAATALINLLAIYLVVGRTAAEAAENGNLGAQAIILATQYYFANGYGAASEYQKALMEGAPGDVCAALKDFTPEGEPN